MNNLNNTDYSYLKHRYKITEDQFKNLIGFLTIILNEDVMKLLPLSPDYILEKFSRYIGNPSDIIKSKEHTSGIHQVLRTQFLERYHEYWGAAETWDFMLNSSISTENFINDD